jgi:general secretion pathway protein D
MNYKHIALTVLFVPTLLSPLFAQTQRTPPSVSSPSRRPATESPSSRKTEQLQDFTFEGADLDTVMTMYCEWTDKIYLKTDAVKATISVKAKKLTTSESIKVIETILAMNKIALVPIDEKYIKVVQATDNDLTGQGLSINIDPDAEYGDSSKFVTQIIQLENVEIPEVQAAVQHVMNAYGKIMALQRSNSLMITDTEANVKRVHELIEFIDQASARIEPRIYEIEYADATEISTKLNEIVAAAQADQKTTPAVTGNPAARTPPGVIRARANQAKDAAAPTKATISQTEGGSTVIIQGTVKVMADERTNIIIIFSQEENFAFFDKIVSVLDVEVEPATTFEVVNLEYADAAELSGTLNDLIGAASSSRSSSRSGSSNTQNRSGNSRNDRNSRTSSQNQRRGSNNTQLTPNSAETGKTAGIENLNRLSEDTKILADERSNSILLMGSKSDIVAIKKVIKSLDVMLEQVMIEAAIFEVTLGEGLEHGIEWLYTGNNKQGAWDGLGRLTTNAVGKIASQALNYYQNITDINTRAAIKLAAKDSNVRLLSTPVIITTDNTEAHLSVGEQRPVVTSTDSFGSSSGTQRSSYEYKDIGIQLTVTPRINPQRVVIMEVLQQADQVGDEIKIDGNDVPVIFNREFEAQISVPDRGTIALGGLVNTELRDSVAKIPILGDIPLIGRYLFSTVSKEQRQTELVVLLTPSVLATEEEALLETQRRYDAMDMQPSDWPRKEWSGSPLQHRKKEEPTTDL